MNEQYFPLSKIQETFWVLNSLYPENTAYHIPSAFLIEGNLDVAAFEKTIHILIQRHQALRAAFSNTVPVVQKFLSPEEIKISIHEITIAQDYNASTLPESILTDIHAPFDLTHPPLLRINLYKLNNKSILTIVFHHIIVDLFSKDLFAEELSLLYNAFQKGQPLPELKPVQDYSDHLVRYKSWFESDEARQMIDSWKQNLPDPQRLLELPADKPRPKDLSLNGSRIYFELEHEFYPKVKSFAQTHSLNTFTVLLTAYAIFLHRFSNQDVITTGVPFTNRRNENDQKTFGCYVNILPLEVNFAANPSGEEILRQIRMAMLQIHRKQEVPYVELVNLSNISTRRNYNAFFQAGFTFEPAMELELEGIKISSLPVERNGAQLDIFLTLWEGANKFCGYWEYAENLFERNTIVKWIGNFKEIISRLINNPRVCVDDYDIVTPDDSAKIDIWNSTQTPYENNKCIHQKFEEQAHKTPQQIALYHVTGNLTYSQFNRKANALARVLIQKKVKPGSIVAISADRSPELMIGILAILKAGAAYLPLGTDYPADRIKNIIDDAGPEIILTTKVSNLDLKLVQTEVLFVDELDLVPLADNPQIAIDSHGLAYIIFTSGSTGVPKGVMIEHHSVLNRIGWMQKAYPIDANSILIQKTPVTFDVSVWELFWWFWEGAGLVLLSPGGERDPEVLIDHIAKYKVTTIHFVPSMFQSFIGYLKAFDCRDKISSLQTIFLSGEALPQKMVNDFCNLVPNHRPNLVNLYGPTEATVDVSHYVCGPSAPVYIGKPIDNTGLFIVNRNNKVQPVGVPGELIITGVNLSRGYLNRPELNAEKFIAFPYNEKVMRAYRTGDLCRWMNDGNIEYLGRIDHQVKLRGFRIELGEIESVMLEHPQIESAAVLLNRLNPLNPHLVGFFTLKNKFYELPEEDIRNFLGKKLPDYMIPLFFVLMDSVLLTTSGKLDRKQLSFPDENEKVEEETHFTPLEKQIAKVWGDVLNKEGINPLRNFFDLGGNSLLAIQVISQLKSELKLNINVLSLIQHPTLRSFADYIVGSR
jgi:amino acid adenylation domain-containing protein